MSVRGQYTNTAYYNNFPTDGRGCLLLIHMEVLYRLETAMSSYLDLKQYQWQAGLMKMGGDPPDCFNWICFTYHVNSPTLHFNKEDIFFSSVFSAFFFLPPSQHTFSEVLDGEDFVRRGDIHFLEKYVRGALLPAFK